MADDPRRFDDLVRTVIDLRSQLNAVQSTLLNRMATHVHAGGGGGGVTDHGALTGLADDDHPQYHNDTRGDARYYTKTQADAAYQPLDSDLTTIAGLTVSNGQLMRRVSGAWAAYTLSASDIGTGTLPIAQVPTGTSSTTVALGNHTHAALTDLDAGASAYIATAESTTSTTYVDLASVGPTASVTLASARRVLVLVKANLFQTGTVNRVYMSWAASGATTLAASDVNAVQHNGSGNDEAYCAVGFLDCAAGTTTFTAKYRCQGSTLQAKERVIAVIPT
jgi:hypothetical protein